MSLNKAFIDKGCQKKSPIYFGWGILLTCLVGLMLGVSSVVFMSFGAFVGAIELDFGWTRTETSLALSIATLSTIFATLFVGVLLNRYGVRKVLIPSILLFSVAVYCMSLMTDSLWHFYMMYMVLPFLGGATGPISYSKVIVNWFDKRRGLALGIGLSGAGLGAAVIPVLVQSMIAEGGWRMAYQQLSIVIVVVCLPMVVMLLKESPENFDDSLESGVDRGSDVHIDHISEQNKKQFHIEGFSLAEVFRQSDFWLMAAAFMLLGCVMNGTLAHLIPMQAENVGMDIATKLAAAVGVSLILGRLLAGYLMDKFFAPYVAIVFLAGPVASLILFAVEPSQGYLFLAAALFGMAVGAEFDVISYFTSKYFGLANYGTVYGILYSVFLLGGIFGPYFMGAGYDKWGNYSIVLLCFSALTFVACFLILLIKSYPNSFQVEAV